MPWVQDDGGRAAAGFETKHADDCVCRAIAIATERPYPKIYAELKAVGWSEFRNDRLEDELQRIRGYLEARGWRWIQTIQRGDGFNSRVHLRADELPVGRLIVVMSEHFAAVV